MGARAFHYNESFVSRGGGGSSVKTAAYISGVEMTDERTGEVCDYSRKERVYATGVVLPKGAPEELRDPSTLWNAVERANKGASAQTARRVNASLDRSLTLEDMIDQAQAMAMIYANQGMCVQWAIHDAEGRNPHVHFLLTDRMLKENATYDEDHPERLWQSKTRKAYVCELPDGTRQKLFPEEAKELGAEKIYKYARSDGKGKERWMTPSEASSKSEKAMSNKRESRRYEWKRVDKNPKSVNVERSGWSRKDNLKSRRRDWATLWNEHTHRAWERRNRGVDRAEDREPEPERASSLSYKERGEDRVAQRHVGTGPQRSNSAVEHNEQAARINDMTERIEALKKEIESDERDAGATTPPVDAKTAHAAPQPEGTTWQAMADRLGVSEGTKGDGRLGSVLGWLRSWESRREAGAQHRAWVSGETVEKWEAVRSEVARHVYVIADAIARPAMEAVERITSFVSRARRKYDAGHVTYDDADSGEDTMTVDAVWGDDAGIDIGAHDIDVGIGEAR